ncbi:MAG: hypothetical protein HND53_02795 [Proteobacteria bacterium]|nr:hypothetical protein [Pseudomonadota bacterium]NOG59401.1 hypothetical protein [Pseudomonadota bacterium]
MAYETIEYLPNEWKTPYETVTHEIAVTSFPQSSASVFDYIQLASNISIPLIIGLIGVYLARKQLQINQSRLKYEMFEKRYEIYGAINSYAFQIKHIPNFITNDDRAEFMAKTAGAEFLFNDSDDFGFHCLTILAMSDLLIKIRDGISIDKTKEEVLRKLDEAVDELKNICEADLAIHK